MFDMPTPSVTQNVRHMVDELDRLRVHIEAALEHTGGTHTFDDVCLMVLSGRVRFWSMEKSFFITEVLEFPRQKHYHMWLGGGDLDEILAMHPQVQQAACECGCAYLSVSGRPGWIKALKPHGWKFNYTALIKEVDTL